MSPTAEIIGAFEAKTRFSELLERVAGGEEITITKHGTPVARLIPVNPTPTDDSRRLAISRMREIAQRNRLAGLRVSDLRGEGRR